MVKMVLDFDCYKQLYLQLIISISQADASV